MNIEKLQSSDLAKYKKLIDLCFGGSNDLAVYEKGYQENDAVMDIMVAKEDDEIIGSLTVYKIKLFTYSFQPALEIFNVCVDPKHRGKKVAKRLFEYVTNYAKDEGYRSIFLTCLDTATDAHRLYESIGMKRTSSVKYKLNL